MPPTAAQILPSCSPGAAALAVAAGGDQGQAARAPLLAGHRATWLVRGYVARHQHGAWCGDGGGLPPEGVKPAGASPRRGGAVGGMVKSARGLGTALGVAVVTLALHAAARPGHARNGDAATASAAIAALAGVALLAT